MRNKILILIPIVLLVLALVGCIPGITPTPEPEEPAPVMEAVALAELVETATASKVWTTEWSIVNVGDVFIREYTLTFEVYYPMRDYVVVTYEGEYLEVGAFDTDTLTLEKYGNEEEPQSVSVTWELFE